MKPGTNNLSSRQDAKLAKEPAFFYFSALFSPLRENRFRLFLLNPEFRLLNTPYAPHSEF